MALSILLMYCISYHPYKAPVRFTTIISILQTKKWRLRAFQSLTELGNGEALIQTQPGMSDYVVYTRGRGSLQLGVLGFKKSACFW